MVLQRNYSSMLQKNATLTELDLKKCAVLQDAEGIRAMAKALEENEALVRLDLCGNNIDPNGKKTLHAAAARRGGSFELVIDR